jgi:hypothetical protein
MGSAIPLRPFRRRTMIDVWTLRISTSFRSVASAHRAPVGLGLHLEDVPHRVLVLVLGSSRRLCSNGLCFMLLTSTLNPNANLASHEVSRPSGDISAGVRFARDYHPQHLPLMSFPSPAAAYSSRLLACLISYKRHLWDSKVKELDGFLSRYQDSLRTVILARLINEQAARIHGRSACWTLTFFSCVLLMCHSPRPLAMQGIQGGGRTSTSCVPQLPKQSGTVKITALPVRFDSEFNHTTEFSPSLPHP